GIYLTSWTFYNIWGKKPFYFSLVPRLALGVGVAGLGWFFGTLRERHFQMRDAIVDHYVKLHPEDFEHLSN
uniref:NADH dehydrogenase [ubiquinone] 1 subunit C2 n=1 Tax=Plectus sambesii TaxID=2011161 RepID=A0A914VMS1_9BILA